jgi:uncharacterized protein (DUF2141 family)
MPFPRKSRNRALIAACLGLGLSSVALTVPAHAQLREEVSNDLSVCRGQGPAVRINISGVKAGGGNLRVQLYRGTKADWLETGRWIHRIEVPARAGSMAVCMPVPTAGTYAIAIRHDLNGNGKTDIFSDGGGMSNNPSINVLNLGKPSYRKTAFDVPNAVKAINIQMKYL